MKSKDREPSKERSQDSTKTRGVKKHGGVANTIVVEDAKERHDAEDSTQTTSSPDGSERVADGRKEKYNDFTASELNRQK